MKKQAFIEQYLPEFFKNMDLLNIKFEDLQEIYENYKKTKAN